MKYYSSLILLLILLNPTFAQDTSKTIDKELKHGIQFQIGGLLDLSNFNGYTFSYRYRFCKCSGIRIGLYTNLSNDDYDITQQLDSVTINPPYYSHNYNFKVSVQYLHSVMRYNGFDLIVGGGPFISFSNSESTFERLGPSSIRKSKYKNKSTGYGLDMILGVEYELASNVILSGEYGLTIIKESADIEEENIDEYGTYNYINKQNGDRDRLQIRSLDVNLGISIFF